MRVVVLVSGSGTLLQSLIDATSSSEHPVDIVAVGADRSAIEGIARAERTGIPTFTVAPADFADRNAWGEALREAVASCEPDWILSAGFMRILPAEFLSAFPNRVLNTHPALLPAFGGKGFHGMHVHRAVVARGCTVSGCTVHLVDNEYDHGRILLQKAVPVLRDDSPESLAARVFAAECETLPEAINRIASGDLA